MTFAAYLDDLKSASRKHAELKLKREKELLFELLDEHKSWLQLNSLSKFYLVQKRLGEKGEGIRRRLMAIDERDRYELF